MSAIIEADIIENPHGDVIEQGESKNVTITWTGANAAQTQTVHLYRIGQLVHISTSWLTGPANTGVAATYAGTAIPNTLWPSHDVHIPTAVLDTATYSMGDLTISATDGTLNVGKGVNPTHANFTVGQTSAFHIHGNYILG
ncbi:MAG: hypothetical protein P4L69_15635 [Desulfosporosinus sp.]|nr:hypothetical protein [Desulfosporosinus sp.]